MQTAQLMATSKAAYGWIGKAPEVKNFNSAIGQCSTAFKQGALGLQLMLGGAHLALDAVVGRRQVLLWCKRQTSEQWSRQTQAAGHLAIAARDFPIQHGWSQTNHQQWHHWSLGVTFRCAEATTTEGYHKIAHQIRESWREQQWLLFRTSKRRDAAAFRRTRYNSECFTFVRKLVQRSRGATLAILLGRVVSPAAFGKWRNTLAQYTRCPLCNAHMAGQHHLYWTCPRKFTTAAPRDLFKHDWVGQGRRKIWSRLPSSLKVLKRFVNIGTEKEPSEEDNTSPRDSNAPGATSASRKRPAE